MLAVVGSRSQNCSPHPMWVNRRENNCYSEVIKVRHVIITLYLLVHEIA